MLPHHVYISILHSCISLYGSHPCLADDRSNEGRVVRARNDET